ncbi:hypothetical protein D3C76_1179430 [compost metagenome]
MVSLADRGDVAVQGFAQVVNDAELEHLEHIQRGQLVGEDDGHQAQAPAVFGGAFRAATGGMGAAQYILEFLGLAQECQAAREGGATHGVVDPGGGHGAKPRRAMAKRPWIKNPWGIRGFPPAARRCRRRG